MKHPYSEYIKNSQNSILKKPKQPNKEWAKDLNGDFSKEVMWMANKHVQRCSISLSIRGMQTKSSDTNAPLLEWLKNKTINLRMWSNWNSYVIGGKMAEPVWKRVARFL